MTRPHDEQWIAVESTGDILSGNRIVAQVVHEEDERHLSRFISAAPAMARALLRLYMAFPLATATEEEANALAEARRILLDVEVLP